MRSESTVPDDTKVLEDFRVAYTAAAGFVEDRAKADALVAELRPVLDTVRAALATNAQSGVAAVEHREALAMTTLFGRRAGELGVTPSSAYAALDAFLSAMNRNSFELATPMVRALSALFLEGFVAAREELLVRAERAGSAQAQPILTLAKGCSALVLSGTHEPEALAAIVDRFARVLHRTDARSCVVDISQLAPPDDSSAAEVFSADASARMLGVVCVFSGVSDDWRSAGAQARVPFELLRVTRTFDEGVSIALGAAGLAITERNSVLEWLRRGRQAARR